MTREQLISLFCVIAAISLLEFVVVLFCCPGKKQGAAYSDAYMIISFIAMSSFLKSVISIVVSLLLCL